MTNSKPRIDIDLAAKARASVLEDGEAKFDMNTWLKCGSAACLAGHIGLVGGVEVEETFDGSSYKPVGNRRWEEATADVLFPEKDDWHPGDPITCRLHDIYLHVSADREETVEAFDDFVRDYCTEEEFSTYLHKSYAYQGQYQHA